jgi:tetratricopeptide (TPR) repeat protein
VSATGGFTVTKDQTIELPTPPDFRTPIKYSADIAPEVKAIIETRFKALQDKLTKDTFDLASWVDLGALHKMAGDYAGAETAWVFVTKAAPKHATAYANLADLYMNFLKNYPKADAMYKQEVAIQPDAIDAYISLAVMYENFYKAGGSPDAILKKGIVANPKSVELELALARYYTHAGRAADAKAAYQAAITAAAGNATLVAQIKAEAGL